MDLEPVEAVARHQEGVVSRHQLRGCGLSDRQIARLTAAGVLLRVHRGIYRTGFARLSLRARAWAAVLASGDGALVSHRAAAAIYVPRLPAPELIDITVAGRNPGHKPGIVRHRVRRIERRDTRWPNGLPVLAPALTILDLAATRSRREVETALQEMVVARLVTDRDLERTLERHPLHRGGAMLRAILELEGPGEGFTRSRAERAFQRIIVASGLPRPRKNAFIEGVRVDAAWDEQRLIVEIDGDLTHRHRAAYAGDRRRDARLIAAGWQVMRFTYAQVLEEPLLVATRMAQALARRGRHSAL